MPYLAPLILVAGLVLVFHGILRTIFGPRADYYYPEAAAAGSSISVLYIVRDGLPIWPAFLLLTAAGIVTYYLSIKMHRWLTTPKQKAIQ